MNKKIIGLILIVVSIIQLIVYVDLVSHAKNAILEKIISDENGTCTHIGDICPNDEVSNISWIFFTGYVTIAIVFACGVLLIMPKRKEKKVEYNIPKNLSEEENKIVQLIKENNGSVFQSELVDKTGFTKVKVTRILDILEGKKVIERKRRGMTNIVILR